MYSLVCKPEMSVQKPNELFCMAANQDMMRPREVRWNGNGQVLIRCNMQDGEEEVVSSSWISALPLF